MEFDPGNQVVKLCMQGMDMEMKGNVHEAFQYFFMAWNHAANEFEKCIAAHYVARLQINVAEKLKWDMISLNLALKLNNQIVKGILPSLYLNIGKCYEDLGELDHAINNYQLALSFISALPDNNYGNMIRTGVRNGLKRLN